MLPKLNHFHFVKYEKFIFYGILFINIIFLCLTKFYPSMDGAAHLYNSRLIAEILTGNETIQSFYKINSVLIPNWTSHFILSSFMLVFPAWVAEKTLLIAYFSGMSISFRTLIKNLNKDNIVLSIFIFPLAHSYLFHLGFYNYSLSFIFYFITFAYWLKNYETAGVKFYLLTSILILLTYLSNLLTFGFLGITLGLFIIIREFKKNSSNKKKLINVLTKRISTLLLCSLPSLILLYFFLDNIQLPNQPNQYSFQELVKWINDFRALIVFDYVGDEIFTEQFLHLLLILLFTTIYFKKSISNSSSQRTLLLLFLTCLGCYFFIPDGAGAGMMSYRFNLFLLTVGVIYIINNYIPKKLLPIATFIIILLHFSLLIKSTITIKNLDKKAILINEASDFIKRNSTVLPLNLSGNWLMLHFSNYLGIDKPLIILENYEVQTGWFPLVWNENQPNFQIQDHQSVNGITWPKTENTLTENSTQIDYILIYGNQEKLEDPKYQMLRELLENHFLLEYKSSNNELQLYQKRIH